MLTLVQGASRDVSNHVLKHRPINQRLAIVLYSAIVSALTWIACEVIHRLVS